MRGLLSLVLVAASATAAHAMPVRLPPPVAVEIVIQGTEISMGNDDIESEDSSALYPGMLHGLKEELAKAPVASVLPRGSVVGLITYADKPMVRWPLRDSAMLSPEVLGTQKDYYRLIGSDLVSAVDQAMAELSATHADRKFLVVISDGNDTNMETAKAACQAMRTRAMQLGIAPIAVIYKNALSDPANAIVNFDLETQTVVTVDSIVNNFEQRIALALAPASVTPTVAPPVVAVDPVCESTRWFVAWRWQLALGSLLLLVTMAGVWFVRRPTRET